MTMNLTSKTRVGKFQQIDRIITFLEEYSAEFDGKLTFIPAKVSYGIQLCFFIVTAFPRFTIPRLLR